MNNLHDFYFGLTSKQRDAYAARVGTTIHYLERLAGGFAKPSMTMATKMVRASGGKLNYEAIMRTWETKHGTV